MRSCDCAPVPARSRDLIRATSAGAFTITESRHTGELALHAHAQWTLTLLLGGGFEERYSGRRPTQTCADFAVLVRRPGEAHADRFAPRGARNLVLEFDGTLLDRAGTCEMRSDAMSGAALESVARALDREMGRLDSARPLALEGLGLQLLAILVRDASTKGESELVGRARVLFDQLFRDAGLRISALAGTLGVHPVALARAFRAHMGVAPSEYVRALRLEWAKRELTLSRTSLAEIALQAGFADQSHFTRVFHARVGVTPKAFRRARGV